MMNRYDLEILAKIAQQCGVTTDMLAEWLEERLILLEDERWTEEALETVRRIRRLTDLGVNLVGIEMILVMRQELLRYQAQIRQFEEEMQQLRAMQEVEIRKLLRQFSSK